VQAKAEKKGEEAKEEDDEAGSVTSEEFNTFLDAMGGRAKEGLRRLRSLNHVSLLDC
jgi:hypothetical protein